jgi:xanthine/uracil/vitamin C permease (AzgA family)
MEQFFKLKERGTSVRTELVAVLTSFFAMVYILMVNVLPIPLVTAPTIWVFPTALSILPQPLLLMQVPFLPASCPICPWCRPAAWV